MTHSHTTTTTSGDAGRPARTPARASAPGLQAAAGNRAVASLLEPRAVQRWPDLDDLLGVAETQSAPGPVPGLIDSAASTFGADAQSGDLGMGTLQKFAKTEASREQQQSADISSSTKTFDSGVDAATTWLGGGTGARFAGGAVKEAWDIGAGLDNMVQNPLGFIQSQSAQKSKEAPALMTNQYFDSLGKLGRGEEGLGDAAGDMWGAFTKGKDNELAAEEAAAAPILDDAKKGDYAGAFGRLGTLAGVSLLGMGETGPLGEVGAEAGAGQRAAQVGEEVAGAGPKPPVPVLPEGPVVPEAPPPGSPDIQIIPRNPKFAEPGTPGFFEQADPLVDTKRPPIVVEPGVDSSVDTRPAFTQRGLGDELPQTRRGVQPQVEPLGEEVDPRSGPRTTRDPFPPEFEPDDSPLARSVPGNGRAIGPAPASPFGPAWDLDTPFPGEPDPAPAFDPVGLKGDPELIRKKLWGY